MRCFLLLEHFIFLRSCSYIYAVCIFCFSLQALKRYAAIPESDRKWSTLHQLITRLSTRSKAKTKRLQQQRSNDSSGDNDCGSSDDDNDASSPRIDNKAALFAAAVVHSDGLEI